MIHAKLQFIYNTYWETISHFSFTLKCWLTRHPTCNASVLNKQLGMTPKCAKQNDKFLCFSVLSVSNNPLTEWFYLNMYKQPKNLHYSHTTLESKITQAFVGFRPLVLLSSSNGMRWRVEEIYQIKIYSKMHLSPCITETNCNGSL